MAREEVDLTLPAGLQFPQSIYDITREFDQRLRHGSLANYRPIPTGFHPLDEILGGGLLAEDLMLLGGPQGIGKTIVALQWARNIAREGRALAVLVCYEHSETYLFHRLLCLESIDPEEESPQGVTLEEVRNIVLRTLREKGHISGMEDILWGLPAAKAAWERITQYWENLRIVTGNPLKTTLEVLDTYLAWATRTRPEVVLFVDYLQKVPYLGVWGGEPPDEDTRISLVVQGLKNLALAYNIPIVAVVAAEKAGLKARRVRLSDVWGPSVVSYEPDLAVMMNPLSRLDERAGRNEILFSVEKNRHGPEGDQFVHTMHGAHFAFNPRGRKINNLALGD